MNAKRERKDRNGAINFALLSVSFALWWMPLPPSILNALPPQISSFLKTGYYTVSEE
jgi:hypothetical protein